MISFYSRGWKDPRIESHVNAEGVRLRFEDASKPELWGEVLIDWNEVVEWAMLRKVIEMNGPKLSPQIAVKATGVVEMPDVPALPDIPPVVPDVPYFGLQMPDVPDVPDVPPK